MFPNSYRRRLRAAALMRGIVTEEWRSGQPSVATGSVVKFGQALLRNDPPCAKIWLYRELRGETDNGLGSLDTAR